MALTNITSIADTLVVQMKALGSAVVFVSDTWSGGDLPWRAIMQIEQEFRAAAITSAQVQEEATKNPEIVKKALVERKGPPTLTEFQAGVAALQAASRDWYDLVIAELHSLPPADLVESVTRDGLYRETVWISKLPEATGLTLKTSTELATLRAHLVTLGAIETV